jgi:hypothetical protein
MSTLALLRQKFAMLSPLLDERQRRLWAGAEALAIGRGGISRVAQATDLSRMTVRAGVRELQQLREQADQPAQPGGIRKPGAGRPRLTAQDATLLADLETLIEPMNRDSETPLRWTCKSTASLAVELRARSHRVSPRKVAQLLHELSYSLPATRQRRARRGQPDRNAQFVHINAQTRAFLARGLPVVSVGTRKKVLKGQEQQPGTQVGRVHAFWDTQLGRMVLPGQPDRARRGGGDLDTVPVGVEALRWWWFQVGKSLYAQAEELLLVVVGSGSRDRLWKEGLQRLADETGLRITVSHFPPGTSKWNEIRHQMFCHITASWPGRPVEGHEVVVQLVGNGKVAQGRQQEEAADEQDRQTAPEATPPAGDWNYTVVPERNHAVGE